MLDSLDHPPEMMEVVSNLFQVAFPGHTGRCPVVVGGQLQIRNETVNNGVSGVKANFVDIENVLFDSGAMQASYISKQWVDANRDKISSQLRPMRGRVKLADNQTVVDVYERFRTMAAFTLRATGEVILGCVDFRDANFYNDNPARIHSGAWNNYIPNSTMVQRTVQEAYLSLFENIVVPTVTQLDQNNNIINVNDFIDNEYYKTVQQIYNLTGNEQVGSTYMLACAIRPETLYPIYSSVPVEKLFTTNPSQYGFTNFEDDGIYTFMPIEWITQSYYNWIISSLTEGLKRLNANSIITAKQQNYLLSKITNVVSDATNSFIINSTMPTYTNYKNNNYTLVGLVPETNSVYSSFTSISHSNTIITAPLYCDAVSSIWYQTQKKYRQLYNDFYNNILLSATYYDTLGSNMSNIFLRLKNMLVSGQVATYYDSPASYTPVILPSLAESGVITELYPPITTQGFDFFKVPKLLNDIPPVIINNNANIYKDTLVAGTITTNFVSVATSMYTYMYNYTQVHNYIINNYNAKKITTAMINDAYGLWIDSSGTIIEKQSYMYDEVNSILKYFNVNDMYKYIKSYEISVTYEYSCSTANFIGTLLPVATTVPSNVITDSQNNLNAATRTLNDTCTLWNPNILVISKQISNALDSVTPPDMTQLISDFLSMFAQWKITNTSDPSYGWNPILLDDFGTVTDTNTLKVIWNILNGRYLSDGYNSFYYLNVLIGYLTSNIIPYASGFVPSYIPIQFYTVNDERYLLFRYSTQYLNDSVNTILDDLKEIYNYLQNVPAIVNYNTLFDSYSAAITITTPVIPSTYPDNYPYIIYAGVAVPQPGQVTIDGKLVVHITGFIIENTSVDIIDTENINILDYVYIAKIGDANGAEHDIGYTKITTTVGTTVSSLLIEQPREIPSDNTDLTKTTTIRNSTITLNIFNNISVDNIIMANNSVWLTHMPDAKHIFDRIEIKNDIYGNGNIYIYLNGEIVFHYNYPHINYPITVTYSNNTTIVTMVINNTVTTTTINNVVAIIGVDAKTTTTITLETAISVYKTTSTHTMTNAIAKFLEFTPVRYRTTDTTTPIVSTINKTMNIPDNDLTLIMFYYILQYVINKLNTITTTSALFTSPNPCYPSSGQNESEYAIYTKLIILNATPSLGYILNPDLNDLLIYIQMMYSYLSQLALNGSPNYVTETALGKLYCTLDPLYNTYFTGNIANTINQLSTIYTPETGNNFLAATDPNAYTNTYGTNSFCLHDWYLSLLNSGKITYNDLNDAVTLLNSILFDNGGNKLITSDVISANQYVSTLYTYNNITFPDVSYVGFMIFDYIFSTLDDVGISTYGMLTAITDNDYISNISNGGATYTIQKLNTYMEEQQIEILNLFLLIDKFTQNASTKKINGLYPYYDLGHDYVSDDILYYIISPTGGYMIGTVLEKKLLDVINNPPPEFAWVQELGHRIIKDAEIVIDGQVIDKHSSELMHLLYVMNKDANHDRGYNIMIGNTTEMYTPSSSQRSIKRLYIPLRFWCCKDAGNALPLNNAIHANIMLNVKISAIEDLLYLDKNSYFVKTPKLKCGFMFQYIFLEDDERVRMANSKLEYLIERYNYNGSHIFSSKSLNKYQGIVIGKATTTSVNDISSSVKIDVKIFDPVKYLVWYVKFYDDVTQLPIDVIHWNKFGYNVRDSSGNMKSINPVFSSIEIIMGGRQRESSKEESYYTNVVPYGHDISSLNIGEYIYSYALHPLILQPSGAANYTEIPDCSIIFNFTDAIIDQFVNNSNLRMKIEIWGCAYNVLRFISGMAGLTFVKTQNS
jgi:hypothetical protein